MTLCLILYPPSFSVDNYVNNIFPIFKIVCYFIIIVVTFSKNCFVNKYLSKMLYVLNNYETIIAYQSDLPYYN